MKILHVLTSIEGSGLGAVVYNYYRNIPEQYIFDFVVVEESKGYFTDYFRSRGGNISLVPPLKKGLIAYFKSLIQVLKSKDYSVIHCHLGEKSIFFLFFSYLFGYKKRILHIHSSVKPETIAEKFKRKLLTNLCKLFATDCFACGKESAKWFYNDIHRIFVMRNAIDLYKYKYSEIIRNNIRKELNLENRFIIGNVGRLSFEKNHTFMLEVFKEIKSRNRNAYLLLVGEGNEIENIKSKIRHYNLDDSVMLFGLSDKVNEILNAFDLFLLPSLSEGVPLVAVEALANGLPVVCSDIITKEIKVNEHVKYISLKKSAKEWADEILNITIQRNDNFKVLEEYGFNIKKEASTLIEKYKQ